MMRKRKWNHLKLLVVDNKQTNKQVELNSRELVIENSSLQTCLESKFKRKKSSSILIF